MKRFLFLLFAAGGLFFLTAGEAAAQRWYGYHGHRHVHRGGGISIGIGRGYGYGYGYHRHYPVRRSIGISYGHYPRRYGGYYGGGYYGGGISSVGYYGGGYYGGCAY